MCSFEERIHSVMALNHMHSVLSFVIYTADEFYYFVMFVNLLYIHFKSNEVLPVIFFPAYILPWKMKPSNFFLPFSLCLP